MSGDPVGALLLLGGMFCAIGASLAACYAIWQHGWEGWDSWNARTGLDEGNALLEKYGREASRPPSRR